MANIGEWDNSRIEVDMTGNSDNLIKISFGQKLRKEIANSVQIIGKGLTGTISGDVGIRVCNLSINDADYSDSFLDTLGSDTSISATFSATYQTPYAYNTCMVYINGVSGITGGKFIIALNND